MRCAAAVAALLLLASLPAASSLQELFRRLNSSAAATQVEEAVRAFFDAEALPKPPYRLALCALVRNEEFYVQEWVLWHYLLGVQHFYLYDNESDDDTRDYLQPLVQLGLVTLRPWPGAEHGAALGAMLSDCFDPGQRKPSQWLAHWDVDEFLVLPNGALNVGALRQWDQHVFHDFLSDFERSGVGSCVVHRMDFGCNGHERPPLGLVLEEFTERFIPVRPGGPIFGKAIHNMDALAGHRGAHAPAQLRDGYTAVFANQQPYAAEHNIAIFEPFRLNHYVTRSHEECLAKVGSKRTEHSWRRDVGASLCDMHMKGSKTWYRVEHGQDYAAAASDVVDAINAILPRLFNASASRRA